MNFKGNFQLVGKLDVAPLLERVRQFTEDDWNRDNWRQEKFEAHRYTTTIPLIFDKDFRHVDPTVMPEFGAMRDVLDPVLQLIRRFYNKSLKYKRLQEKHGIAYPVRIILARLAPGGVIIPHMDRNFSLSHAHRIHVPLVTHDDVLFKVGGQRQPMKVGEVWEINNRHIHEVENRSDVWRIHMIVDWAIPGERCCCATTVHPDTPCTPENCKVTDFRPEPCTCLH